MNPDPKFHEASGQQVIWKNDEVRAFAVSLIRHALDLNDNFTTDIVPDEERGSGPGIAGTCVELLKNASLLEPIGVLADGVWYQHRVKSAREHRNGAWLNVYKLASRALAEEFLKRNGHLTVQAQLFL